MKTVTFGLFCLGAIIVTCLPDALNAKKGKLVRLDEDTWSDLLTGEWMVDL